MCSQGGPGDPPTQAREHRVMKLADKFLSQWLRRGAVPRLLRPALGLDLDRDPTEYLMTLLAQPACSFTATAEREIVRDVIAKRCFFGLEHKSTTHIHKVTTDVLSDGNRHHHY